MCQYQTLFYDEKVGYVIRCMHCENFQIGYGNVLINLHTPDFHDFVEWIRDCPIDDYGATDPGIKSIIIPTPCDGLKLYLSQRELRDLHQMLESADSEWRSQEMLQLFANRPA
ncbi:DUF6686 family protein [Paraflavitalea sp. CAU 1676]|uniref:DUF6686 family protein n=1 Tax=Paraflavitalea sp. CAU 1676 TaxID=3032598 RepID=UPI0023DB3DDC|nr:DUF6686 family protein [Paraflavitalea sp. CAU 1676]MDF2187154.1 hypothetical protein [Paraflavitalea sp. CAU 1676]